MTEIRIVRGQIWKSATDLTVQVTEVVDKTVQYRHLSTGPGDGEMYWRDFVQVFTLVDCNATFPDQIKEGEVWIDKLFPEYLATIVSVHHGLIVFALEREGPWPDDDLCVLREGQFREGFVRRSE